MGAARVEMYRKWSPKNTYAGAIRDGIPVQVNTETTSTTATISGSRITAPANQGTLLMSAIVDEDCYISIGADPTAAAATSWLLKANVAREFTIRPGEKISFKDVA